MSRFLHLKFASGRPPPVAASLPWSHEVDPARDSLHDTLASDVQREGVVRYLQQNFPEGTYVHDVVHEREGDAGMYVLCTKNWARSVGDPVRSALFILPTEKQLTNGPGRRSSI